MSTTHARGETHGCIVCGRLYQLYVVYDEQGKFIASQVMSGGGRRLENSRRALVACEKHSVAEVEAAMLRVYGEQNEDED